MYHHNLETSREYYKNICTTHSYDERIDIINAESLSQEEILKTIAIIRFVNPKALIGVPPTFLLITPTGIKKATLKVVYTSSCLLLKK